MAAESDLKMYVCKYYGGFYFGGAVVVFAKTPEKGRKLIEESLRRNGHTGEVLTDDEIQEFEIMENIVLWSGESN